MKTIKRKISLCALKIFLTKLLSLAILQAVKQNIAEFDGETNCLIVF